ncbi:MAG: aromatic ring-opening dioxygenase LigB subunit [Bacillariaceae sp.]
MALRTGGTSGSIITTRLFVALLSLLLLLSCWFDLSSSFSSSDYNNCGVVTIADAIFVGSILLPHGDFALDPTFFQNGTVERNSADKVALGARMAGRWLLQQQQQRAPSSSASAEINSRKKKKNHSNEEEDEPMIILLTTPHGLKLDYNYGIYINSKGSGTATIGEDCITNNIINYDGYDGIRGGKSNENNVNVNDNDKDNNFNNGGGGNETSLESINNKDQRKKQTYYRRYNNNNRRRRRRDCQHIPYNVTVANVDLAPIELGKDLLYTLQNNQKGGGEGYPVSGIYGFNDDASIPLGWGEIIPLLLLLQKTTALSSSSSSSSSSKILPLIWTFPHRRYDHGGIDMIDELLQIGADIMEWAENRPERIGMVVSGDLSHTHLSNGPYGYSNASAPFDKAIGRWAGTGGYKDEDDDPCHPGATSALLKRAKELQPNAMSCGFTGYVLWHGMMCSKRHTGRTSTTSNGINSTNNSSNKKDYKNKIATKFRSKVFVNRNVTYYGMIAASFEPYNDDHSGGGSGSNSNSNSNSDEHYKHIDNIDESSESQSIYLY